jgi:hypothetical protein
MTSKGLRTELDAALRRELKRMGFVREASLSYLRRRRDVTDVLRFHCRRTPDGGYRVAGVAGIAIDAIGGLLETGSRNEGTVTPTVLTPFHFLHESRDYFEWPLDESHPVDETVQSIVAELEALVLPYFAAYGSVEAMRKVLAAPRPPECFVLSPEQQIVAFAALEHTFGSPEEATRILERALEERRDAPPKDRRAIEALRQRLGELGLAGVAAEGS